MPPRFLPRLTDDRAKALMPASTALGSSTASVFETAKPGTVPWAMPGMAASCGPDRRQAAGEPRVQPRRSALGPARGDGGEGHSRSVDR